MGNVASTRSGAEAGAVYLRDQERLSITSVTVTGAKGRLLLTLSPNEYPASRFVAKRESPDDPPVEYVQDPESGTYSPSSFLLRLPSDDDLTFKFTFVVRQKTSSYPSNAATTPSSSPDTSINGLTFIFAGSTKELDNLIIRELHADPNLHKNNPNVQHIGDYSTSGSPSVQFEWIWKWKPPRINDENQGWRNCCSFVEYDQRNHRLDPLASFSFWVTNTQRLLNSPKSPPPRLEPGGTIKLRVPSSQSIESRMSDSDGATESKDQFVPQSPTIEAIPEDALDLEPALTGTTAAASVKVDVTCQRPRDDISMTEDGPVFRATMKAMEQKTGNMRTRWKKVLKRADGALEAQTACHDAMTGLMDALNDAASSNAHAVQPAMEHYFDKIAKEILAYDRRNTDNLKKMIIDPITKLYNHDIKQAENKKRDFEEESKEYYSYVSRYLGQRQDTLKEKKREQTDSKYQAKRRNFELKRFDYSSFMQDLHGGRKDQEVLSNLTRFADAQAKGFLLTAKKIEAMMPQLEALNLEVREADKSFQLHRTEREEKRRALEKSAPVFSEPDASAPTQGAGNEVDVARAGSLVTGRAASQSISNAAGQAGIPIPSAATTSQSSGLAGSPSNKFKGIRDLEERDPTSLNVEVGPEGHNKEGLVWALSRPGSHADPKGLNKQAWHKFWIVLDQGKLSEYTNWKQKVNLHMDPIDLRVASVREARNADRRFCFEIITPHFTRVYQATSEDDMKSWISTINNALQSAVETGSSRAYSGQSSSTDSPPSGTGLRKDIASVLTGKSASTRHAHGYGYGAAKSVGRHATVGNDRPRQIVAENAIKSESSAKLLASIREADAGNRFCADCGSESKVDWVSLNLGILICIDCSGIHRSLGTHVSKVRSIPLDPSAFNQDVVEILLTIGNRVSNMIWEARLSPVSNSSTSELPESLPQKPGSHSNREARLRFITAKYSDRAFVLTPDGQVPTKNAPADDTLLITAIKKNSTQSVLHALALRANPNATDRSRATHAVYLALAAADPAFSDAVASSPSTSPTPSPSSNSTVAAAPRRPFPIAELLLLNGATLPTAPPPIPLSRSARAYLEAKRESRNRTGPMLGPSRAKPLSHVSNLAGSGITHSQSAMSVTTGTTPAGASTPTSSTTLAIVPASPPSVSPARPVSSSAEKFETISSQGGAQATPTKPRPITQPLQLHDENVTGVGTGGDSLTALPVISPTSPPSSGEKKKRLSGGARLVKPAPQQVLLQQQAAQQAVQQGQQEPGKGTDGTGMNNG